MSRRNYSSTAQRTTLSAGCTDVATTMTVTAVTGWPGTTPYTIIVDPDTVNEEIMSVTARAGLNLTVTRAVGGSVGVAHSSGAVVQHGVYAADFDEANLHVNSSTSVHGVTGAVVGTTDTQTLAGKTLTTPTIADLTNATHNHSNAAGGGNIPESSVANLVTDLAGKTASTLTVNAQTGTTYTFVAADAVSKLVTFSNASPVTATVPSATFAQGQHVPIVNKGAGAVTLAGSGVTLNGASLVLAQYESATLVFDSATVAYVVKGGGLPKASVSSTTGSPTTGANGSKTYYKFNASGSVTIGTAGLVEILVVGGGAGGGTGGGGGAGGHVTTATAYLAAGTHTITVGAGGAGGSGGAAGIQGNTSGVGPYFASGGGNQGSGANTAGLAGASGGGGRGSGVGGSGVSGLGSSGGSGGTDPTGGGGGGASAVGSNGSGGTGGAGGTGTSTSLDGTPTTRAGGGGGGGTAAGGSATGGGGAGGTTTGTAGTANTGGGGGGASATGFVAGNGGSGIVILLVG